jgi:hypothetical protein
MLQREGRDRILIVGHRLLLLATRQEQEAKGKAQ